MRARGIRYTSFRMCVCACVGGGWGGAFRLAAWDLSRSVCLSGGGESLSFIFCFCFLFFIFFCFNKHNNQKKKDSNKQKARPHRSVVYAARLTVRSAAQFEGGRRRGEIAVRSASCMYAGVFFFFFFFFFFNSRLSAKACGPVHPRGRRRAAPTRTAQRVTTRASARCVCQPTQTSRLPAGGWDLGPMCCGCYARWRGYLGCARAAGPMKRTGSASRRR